MCVGLTHLQHLHGSADVEHTATACRGRSGHRLPPQRTCPNLHKLIQTRAACCAMHTSDCFKIYKLHDVHRLPGAAHPRVIVHLHFSICRS